MNEGTAGADARNDTSAVLARRARADGELLLSVAGTVYTVGVVGIWFLAAGTVFFALWSFTLRGNFGLPELLVVLLSSLLCAVLYAGLVLLTHAAKVASHTSLATVAMMESVGHLVEEISERDHSSKVDRPDR